MRRTEPAAGRYQVCLILSGAPRGMIRRKAPC